MMLARRCLKKASKAAKALVADFLSANATSAFEEEPPRAPSPQIPDWA